MCTCTCIMCHNVHFHVGMCSISMIQYYICTKNNNPCHLYTVGGIIITAIAYCVYSWDKCIPSALDILTLLMVIRIQLELTYILYVKYSAIPRSVQKKG